MINTFRAGHPGHHLFHGPAPRAQSTCPCAQQLVGRGEALSAHTECSFILRCRACPGLLALAGLSQTHCIARLPKTPSSPRPGVCSAELRFGVMGRHSQPLPLRATGKRPGSPWEPWAWASMPPRPALPEHCTLCWFDSLTRSRPGPRSQAFPFTVLFTYFLKQGVCCLLWMRSVFLLRRWLAPPQPNGQQTGGGSLLRSWGPHLESRMDSTNPQSPREDSTRPWTRSA